jgi:hypothetical protein
MPEDATVAVVMPPYELIAPPATAKGAMLRFHIRYFASTGKYRIDVSVCQLELG